MNPSKKALRSATVAASVLAVSVLALVSAGPAIAETITDPSTPVGTVVETAAAEPTIDAAPQEVIETSPAADIQELPSAADPIELDPVVVEPEEELPVGDLPGDDSPEGASPIGSDPTAGLPVVDAPREDIPTGADPSEEFPTGEDPAEEFPGGDNPGEDDPEGDAREASITLVADRAGAHAGGIISYTVTVVNGSNVEAGGVSVTLISSGIRLSSVPGGSQTFVNGTARVEIGAIGADQTHTVTVVGLVPSTSEGGVLTVSASAALLFDVDGIVVETEQNAVTAVEPAPALPAPEVLQVPQVPQAPAAPGGVEPIVQLPATDPEAPAARAPRNVQSERLAATGADGESFTGLIYGALGLLTAGSIMTVSMIAARRFRTRTPH